MPATDERLHDFLAGSVTALIVALILYVLVGRLRRGRPDLDIGWAVAVAVSIRVVAAGAISLTGVAATLRGGDEVNFVAQAGRIAQSTFGSEVWTDALTGSLYKFLFAAQIGVLDSPDLALRTAQAGIAVAGLALLAVAVYELAGARAAKVAMWVLALEPSSVFFSTLLHKEANMILASGLVAYGGATLWKRGDLRSLLPIVLGCLIAVATRPYAGWFLIAAGVAVTLHAGLRAQHRGSARAMALVVVVVAFAAVATPTVLETSSDESLETNLQPSQEANTSDESNLQLEKVDFSSRGAVIVNLPRRIRDIVLRPYPWQLANASQQFGLLGTIIVLLLLPVLVRELIRSRGRIMDYGAPLVYLSFFLLIAYSLSAGNAGTAFRYRVHLITVALCLLVVLVARRQELEAREPAGESKHPTAVSAGPLSGKASSFTIPPAAGRPRA